MSSRVLVVEDDESMRELLRLHLTNAGYAVDVAEDGIQAGYAVLKAIPQVIICDVDMPHMNGFELIAALRAEESLPQIPVIFVTSHEEGAPRAVELGCDFLTKPLLVDELLTAVRRALDL